MCISLVNGKLPSLPKLFCAAIDTTDEGLRTSVSILVLFEVLRKGKRLVTVRTNVLLLVEVPHVVPLERILTRTELFTIS